MRKTVASRTNRSFKTLLIYGLLVFCFILVALLLRAFTIIKASKFDGEHRFTLAVGDSQNVFELVSFEPMTSSLSLLTFSHNSSVAFSNLNTTFGVIPDGSIKTKYPFVLTTSIPSLLQSLLFHINTLSQTITIYDLLRFYFYAHNIPASTVVTKKLSVSSSSSEINRIVSLLFTDSAISQENVTIQIINATGQSGLGSRLERVISNLGGNVVSVETSLGIEPISKIQYYGKETYTLNKLENLLPYRREMVDKEPIARIVIIIGKDSMNTRLF